MYSEFNSIIQVMGGKVYLRCKGKTLLDVVNKHLKIKSLWTMSSNVLPLHPKQYFLPVIWIFTEGEGDGIPIQTIFLNLPYFPLLGIHVFSRTRLIIWYLMGFFETK